MVTTLSISKYVNSLLEVETKFSAQQSISDRFFCEWHEDLPELTEVEKERCNLLKERYLYHRHHGHLSEGLVNQIAIAPLLEMASFYDPPFEIRAEYPVQLESIEFDGNEETSYQGRIDTLVIHKKLWVLVIESKGQAFSIESGMAQALTYILDSPNQLQPTYGFISNGGFSIFLKVMKGEVTQYQFSNDFSLYNRRTNELLSVLQILKKISRLFQ